MRVCLADGCGVAWRCVALQIVAKEQCARILMGLRAKNEVSERDVNSVSKYVMSDAKVLNEFSELIYQKSNDLTLEQWVKVKLGHMYARRRPRPPPLPSIALH